MRSLVSLFGQSPFGPLQAHMEKVADCAAEVPPLFHFLLQGDLDKLLQQRDVVVELEGEADAIKNELRDQLPRRMFMPVDRRDLLEILDLQDTIADVSEDIADLLTARTWIVPDTFAAPMTRLLEAAAACARAGTEVIRSLDEVVNAGFGGPDRDRIRKLIDEVLRLEDEADERESEMQHLVFSSEDELGAVGVVMWLKLLELVGDIADYSKKASNRLRLLVAS